MNPNYTDLLEDVFQYFSKSQLTGNVDYWNLDEFYKTLIFKNSDQKKPLWLTMSKFQGFDKHMGKKILTVLETNNTDSTKHSERNALWKFVTIVPGQNLVVGTERDLYFAESSRDLLIYTTGGLPFDSSPNRDIVETVRKQILKRQQSGKYSSKYKIPHY